MNGYILVNTKRKAKQMNNKKNMIICALIWGLFGSGAVLAQEVAQNNGRDDALSAWKGKVLQFRTEKDHEFKHSSTSPMAATQRLTVKGEPGKPLYIAETNHVVTVSPQPVKPALFTALVQNNQWTWERMDARTVCMVADKPVSSGAPLVSEALFTGGECVIKVYTARDDLIVIVFDAARPQIQHFSQLLYYPPDPDFAVPATLEKLPVAEPVMLTTSRNLKKNYYRYARIHFTLAGKELVLTAFKASLADDEDGRMLFIPFGDLTNGTDTYDVGRFLEIPEPATAQFTLDFNLCFNPLCNYSDAYNCPIPPRENILDASIKAGEKTYPH